MNARFHKVARFSFDRREWGFIPSNHKCIPQHVIDLFISHPTQTLDEEGDMVAGLVVHETGHEALQVEG